MADTSRRSPPPGPCAAGPSAAGAPRSATYYNWARTMTRLTRCSTSMPRRMEASWSSAAAVASRAYGQTAPHNDSEGWTLRMNGRASLRCPMVARGSREAKACCASTRTARLYAVCRGGFEDVARDASAHRHPEPASRTTNRDAHRGRDLAAGGERRDGRRGRMPAAHVQTVCVRHRLGDRDVARGPAPARGRPDQLPRTEGWTAPAPPRQRLEPRLGATDLQSSPWLSRVTTASA